MDEIKNTLVSLALPEEASIAAQILSDVAGWLISKGMTLWSVDEFSSEKILSVIEKRELYLAKTDNEYSGAIIIQNEDPIFWPEITDSSSIFFHKLAVRRKFSGGHVSKKLMDHAYDLGKQRGRKFLRLDCSVKHQKLRPFYEKHGFHFVDNKQLGPFLVDRLQKEIWS